MDSILDLIQSQSINPSNRSEVIRDKNETFRSLSKDASRKSDQLVDTLKQVNVLQTQADERRIQFEQQTADQLSDLVEPQILQLNQQVQQFQQVQNLLTKQDQEIFELEQQANSDELGFFERRKARKELEEVREEAFRTAQQRNNIAENIQGQVAVQQNTAQQFLEARNADFQAGINTQRQTQIQRLQRRQQELQTALQANSQIGQFTSQISTLTPGEIETNTAGSGAFARMLWNITNNSDPEILRKFDTDKTAQRSMAELFGTLPPERREALIPLVQMSIQANEQGDPLDTNEMFGMTVTGQGIETLLAFGDLTTDKQLKQIINEGTSALQRRLRAQAEEVVDAEISEGKATATPEQRQKLISERTQQLLATSSAEDVIRALDQDIQDAVQPLVTANSERIFDVTEPQTHITASAYPRWVVDIFQGEDMKEALNNPKEFIGLGGSTRIANAFQTLLQQSGDSENNKRIAAEALAEFVKNTSESFIRENSPQDSVLMDRLSLAGIRPSAVKVPVSFSGRSRRLLQLSGQDGTGLEIDLSTGEGIIANLQRLKAISRKQESIDEVRSRSFDPDRNPASSSILRGGAIR